MPEDTGIARAFGANVRMTVADQGLYLVLGRRTSPVSAVRRAGGQVIMQIPNTHKLLALMHVEMAFACRSDPDVAFAGPVAVDPERFSRFAAQAGLDVNS